MRKIAIILFLLSYSNRLFALAVNVEGLNSAKGQVCLIVMVENTDTSWREDAKTCQKIQESTRTIFQIAKPNSPFALKAYHDVNDNNKMDYYFFLIPKEGLGYSNIERPFNTFSMKDSLLSPNLEQTTVHLRYLLH